MPDKQPAALETKNERSESKPNTAKRYKTEKAELRRRIVSIVLLLVLQSECLNLTIGIIISPHHS